MFSAYIDKIQSDPAKTLLSGLEFVDWKKYIKSDSKVFIKPNLTFPSYREGVTTSPCLLKYLIRIIGNRCSTITVGESDGGNNSFKAEQAFAGHYLYDICKEAGAKLVNLSNIPSVFTESKIQSKKVKVLLPKMLLSEIDCFISVPVLKVHVITEVSLGIKNLWGCYPDTMRCLHHQNLDLKLALMSRVLDPKITIIDGLYALNGHGPMFGEPVKTDMLLLSNNVVVADALGTTIMGLSVKSVNHITVAEREGIGTTKLEEVDVNQDWTRYKAQFRIRRTMLDRVSSLLYHSDFVARQVMSSPATPLIYGIARKLRTPEEKALAAELITSGNHM
jgi:uncharacterized protein (DUF362 family)